MFLVTVDQFSSQADVMGHCSSTQGGSHIARQRHSERKSQNWNCHQISGVKLQPPQSRRRKFCEQFRKKKKNYLTTRENCFAEESIGGRKNPKNSSKQTPTQVLFIRKSWRSFFFRLFWEALQCRRGREWGKQATPESETPKPPSSGFQQLLVSSPRAPDPGIPGCSLSSQALFLFLHLLKRGSQALLNL